MYGPAAKDQAFNAFLDYTGLLGKQRIKNSDMSRLFVIIAILCMAAPPAANAGPFNDYDRISATIFAYYRIGEDAYPDSNLSTAVFAAHIQELADGNYNVVALPDLVNALKTDTPLPENAVVLTFDGGYRSVLENAFPLLEEHGFPYTIFIAANQAGESGGQYLDWADIKKLHRSDLATIGMHPAAYTGLYSEGDTAIRKNLNTALGDFEKHLGIRPDFFAYPFGEFDAPYAAILADYNFTAIMGQNSGVTYNGSDLSALPRFLMTDAYGDLERFRMAAQAKPLPVSDVQPATTIVNDNPPAIGFTLHPDFIASAETLGCYASNQDRPAVEKLGNDRFELRLSHPFTEDRARINCTLPAGKNDNGETIWRWFGLLFTMGQSVMDETAPLEP